MTNSSPHDNEQQSSDGQPSQPKKVNLADAIKQKLEQKKQQQQQQKTGFGSSTVKPLKNQNIKKPNNQRRRTGGS